MIVDIILVSIVVILLTIFVLYRKEHGGPDLFIIRESDGIIVNSKKEIRAANRKTIRDIASSSKGEAYG